MQVLSQHIILTHMMLCYNCELSFPFRPVCIYWICLLNSLRKFNTNFNDFSDFQTGHLTMETVCANVLEIFLLKGGLYNYFMTYTSERCL